MAKCIFENLSPEQAAMFAEWFEGQGEQDCEVWFEENGVDAPITDVGRVGGYMEIEDSGDVIVYCRD